ncbi:MAG: bifunctional NADP-dependent methylenetetrahydromethanopterin dehydrogenase/methylenetetrahydrofolate dehydrogenase [Planctomycetaceae bacterium]|nr:bifunctional NADP-dependent methylenetetrahydromethanopterin dehydrogenase/methylenetetrahydrofolate dehydrogenase [Planctomycetales bacterium]MCB9873975.1 bifunctional NADP-dependent methylenetetrahydromethanopterin dehydrogenase/methylenetetrahydrofolate dehydrogenase [Planctomycetaceae bacterium]MCB9938562.1 bifunctional NADP-dependent methylenetetrahydromethanopterin dehydrogenase/methylenetetrahydrofolate dehydrogenase [Planctomycetaceae bacterium]HRX82356.1 methylenetetrahydromethanopte
MTKPKILIQLDGDDHASVFDAVVAVDSDIDHLFQYRSVQPEQVRDLVHGAMFTRGPQDLHNTAVFIGGANVAQGESLLRATADCFFGPMRVSVMLDANGANTTAAAAVLAAARHVDLSQSEALVLAGTGPVGQRAVRLLARAGCKVRVASRSVDRAAATCEQVRGKVDGALLTPLATSNSQETAKALEGANVVVAAGAAGIELLSAETRAACSSLRVAVDLNAVPPLGIGGVGVTDKAVDQNGVVCYGAIGVGGTKMKIHKAAIKKLFVANNLVLDAEEIFEIGRELEAAS